MAGLGYYADNGHAVRVNLMNGLFPMAIAPPVPIDIHKLVCGRSAPDLGLFEGPTFTKPRTRRRTKAKVKAVKCYEASLHQDDVCWPDDGSLSMTSRAHRAKVPYALDSLNSNA